MGMNNRMKLTRNILPAVVIILGIEVVLLSVQNIKFRQQHNNLDQFQFNIRKNVGIEVFPNIFVIDSSNRRMPLFSGSDLREHLLILLPRGDYKEIIMPWLGTTLWTGFQSRFKLTVVLADDDKEPVALFLSRNHLLNCGGVYLLSAANMEEIRRLGIPAAFVLLPNGKIIQHLRSIDTDWAQSIN
jgi:hypothetical protein